MNAPYSGQRVGGLRPFKKTRRMAWENFFDDFSSIGSRWTARTNGTGSVTASDSNAVLDEGGTGTSAVAALVLNEPLDFTRSWIAYACVRWTGASFPGAYPPPMMAIVDSAGIPTVGTNATWNSIRRLWFENQLSGTVGTNRWQCRFRQNNGTLVHWMNDASNAWGTIFEYSWRWADNDNYLIIGFRWDAAAGLMHWAGWVIDDESTSTETNGIRMVVAPSGRAFGNGNAQIDQIDNAGYLVLGHLVNDAGGLNQIHRYEWFALYEFNGVNDEHIWYSVKQRTTANYELYHATCPMGLRVAGHPLWFPDADLINSAIWSRGTDVFHQGLYVYDTVND